MGVLPLLGTISLVDVVYVPNLNCSLIYVSKLLKYSNCFAVFTGAIFGLQYRFSRTLIRAGEEHDGIYYFMDVSITRVNKVNVVVDQELWHRRLGHPAFYVFSNLSLYSCVLNKASFASCDVCF